MGRQSRSAGSLAFFLSVQSIGRDCGIMIVPVAMSGAMSVPMPEKVHGEHAEGEYDPNPIVTKPSHHATPLQYRFRDASIGFVRLRRQLVDPVDACYNRLVKIIPRPPRLRSVCLSRAASTLDH